MSGTHGEYGPVTGPFAVRTIDRADAAAVEALGKQGVATVHEAQGKRGLMDPYMRPIYPGAAAAGSAVTVLAPPGDNWMIHVAVELVRPGDLLVVGTTAPSTHGYFGELLATSLQAHGVRGLVIDAGCRDIAALQDIGFPVWSKAVSAQGTVKETPGSVNVPIECAGALVHPGDVVVADDDGVVVVPRDEASAVANSGRQRSEREAIKRERLASGTLSLDLDDMRDRLAGKGLTYVETAAELGAG